MIDLITLHPKLVHFPIALIFTGLLFEALYLIKKNEFFEKASRWLFSLGLAGSLAAMVSGLIAEDLISHSDSAHDIMEEHEMWMMITTLVWAISFILMVFLQRKKSDLRKFLIIPYILICTILTIGSNLGGKLVFEHGVGVKVPETQKFNNKNSLKEGQGGGHHHDHSHEHKH